MEYIHRPEDDEVDEKIDKLFLKYDLAYCALMSMILDRTHQGAPVDEQSC